VVSAQAVSPRPCPLNAAALFCLRSN